MIETHETRLWSSWPIVPIIHSASLTHQGRCNKNARNCIHQICQPYHHWSARLQSTLNCSSWWPFETDFTLYKRIGRIECFDTHVTFEANYDVSDWQLISISPNLTPSPSLPDTNRLQASWSTSCQVHWGRASCQTDYTCAGQRGMSTAGDKEIEAYWWAHIWHLIIT